MDLPFAVEQFLNAFKNYNRSVYPIQIIFYIPAPGIIFLTIKKTAYTDRLINSALSFFWLWMGIIYHLILFAPINKAAYFFGSFFILQGLLFFYQGMIKDNLKYRFRFDKERLAGALLIIFALIIYPFLGYVSGHIYPASPTFGLPCPTTIFTFGILMWCDKKIPLSILVIPFIWSIIGFFAAVKLGVREDIGLQVAGITGTVLITIGNREKSGSAI